ncbi:hypothetical protein [Nesterenkonia populi]|uniref:hypothetical protein n=1 Tax=Nesterenkonia populi TaxID=1591087 RepID=UPI0011BE7112|nr:hypothetical protein [Nesterenkonia populi]
MSETSKPRRPLPVLFIYLILFLQGGFIIVGAVAEVVLSEAAVLDAAGVVALLVLMVLTGVILILLGFQIFRGSAAARAPAMVLQLMIVILSASLMFSGGLGVGASGLALVPAAAALILLFIRPTQEWLEGTAEPDPKDA